MANGLQPSFIKCFYHTLYGAHTRTVPIRQWYVGGGVGGSALNWLSDPVSVDTVLKATLNLEKVLVPSTTVFDYYEVWNYPDPTDLPIPVATAPLAIAGTGGGTGWAEAVEQTFIIRTAAFGLFKWIMLDVPTDNFFGKVNPADFSSDFTALMSNLTADTSIYAGRDNSKPNIVKQATITLNEKLRRAYKLT